MSDVEDEAVTQLREEVERLAVMVKEQDEKLQKQDNVTRAPDSIKPVVMMNSRRSPELKFFELRDKAVHWLRRPVADKKSAINQEVQSANFEEGGSTSNLLEVVKRQEAMIERQQQQINSILSKSGSTCNKHRKPLQCWTCGSTSHINRNCPQRRMENPRGRDNALNE
ncbi:unnamed protein product [Mytilus coruscus]|uniref:CCHC-type domain-containing protein n=1 Tax=Mytilus coruscus TaxID=42192 RepID=A0A6J8BU04_MYTCO|nr:unnamed protein product [Mytilus coruscus]